ncbi:MAG: hypothetical protein M0D55_11405 [Elusimicrobiota bacterium]|nr:MAG: hypothetical protein M0D55_11405 [Elusimicrobiota bacterium]
MLLAPAAALFGLALAHAQTEAVRFYGPLSRVVTPNGDHINDQAFFCFENPQRSDISGKIYTLLGAQVASIGVQRDRTALAGAGCPSSIIQATYLTWDGRADGVRVRSGVYVYRLIVEDRVFSGTLLIVR